MPLRFIAVSLLMFSCFTATPSQIRQPKFEDFKREMMPQVGQRITIVGILQTGKLGWWVAFKDWGVYIHATNGSDFARMSNLSSFDGKTEARILQATEDLMRGRTTFMIAHRLNTLKNCDLILVLENGRLLEKRESLPEVFAASAAN